MILEPKANTFEALCDTCGKRADAIDGSRELAITRLMLRGWHVKLDGTTFCAECEPSPSVRFGGR